jgi:Glycosyl transferase family 2
MKVSILLAVHNGVPYVQQAIDDALAQTFGDFELLVVDDASTDATAEILRACRDPRLRVLRNDENIGQAPSLNRGLDAAYGEYVARIDADDRMLPTRLERQIAVLDGEPEVALVGTWMDVVDERDRLWATVRGDIGSYADLVGAVLTDSYPFGHPSLMYRRAVVRELGGYDPTLAPAEDKDLYRRLALARHEVRVVREPLVRYRRHEAQLSNVQRERQLAVDHEGQERFLAELVGTAHAGALRRLLAEGASPDGNAAELLDELLERARTRLALDSEESRDVRRTVAAHLVRRGLAAGPNGRAVLAWAGRTDVRARAARLALPFVPPIGRGAHALRRSLRNPRLDPLRRRARKSRWLRSIYSRLG